MGNNQAIVEIWEGLERILDGTQITYTPMNTLLRKCYSLDIGGFYYSFAFHHCSNSINFTHQGLHVYWNFFIYLWYPHQNQSAVTISIEVYEIVIVFKVVSTYVN